jgi:DAACS family dicarboxylate/amino acid:cation (Na+ or H+) symporter
MTLIDLVIQVAPIAVAALLFNMTSQLGFDALSLLGRYVGVVVLALAIHQFAVYGFLVRVLGGMSPRAFFRGIDEAMLTASRPRPRTRRCPPRSASPRSG